MNVQERSYEAIAEGSKSFAAASRLLAPAVRDDVVKLYAWCRHCDDVIDGQSMGGELAALAPEEQRRRLASLHRDTARAIDGDEDVPQPFQALREVARAHDFPRDWPFDLLEGFRMDVEAERFATLEDTLVYCYHVAGIVGVMMARVMGVRDEPTLDRACDLGLAFQLTNIARDVMEDARGGRSYVPEAWTGGRAGAPFDEDDREDALRAAQRLVREARPYYASARTGLAALPFRSAWAIAAARRIYRAIGTKLAAAGPDVWDERVFTTRREKAAMVALASGDALRSRVGGAEFDRAGLWTRPRRRDGLPG